MGFRTPMQQPLFYAEMLAYLNSIYLQLYMYLWQRL